jgi:hypothetical protein
MPNLPNFDSNIEIDKPVSISDMNQLLREIWIEEKRNYSLRETGHPSTYRPGPVLDGGISAAGKYYQPFWPKLSKFILDNNLDPLTFIRAQFYQSKGSPPPSPNVLLSDIAIRKYNQYKAAKCSLDDLRVAKDAQIRATNDAVKLNKKLYGSNSSNVYRDIIMDANISISALFRYSLAIETDQKDLQQKWLNAALKQYIYEQQSYDTVWGELIPKELKALAEKIKRGA